MPSKIVELLQPWTAADGESHPVGSTVMVDEEVANDLITRGIGVTAHVEGPGRGPTAHVMPADD